MSRAWFSQKERSCAFWIVIIRWIAMRLGRPIARIILYPISIYFLCFSINARKASRQFLTRVSGRPAGIGEQFRHFHCFSATILDRVFLFTGQEKLLDIQFHNEDILLEQLELGRGCILLGTHLGSFEVLRALVNKQEKVSLKVLMYESHNENIVRYLTILNPEIASSVISIGGIDSLLQVKDSLDDGNVVGILADRIAENDKQIKCEFLGAKASFPTGPMTLAVVLNVPVVVFYGLYKGGRRYDIHFELLTKNPGVSRANRANQINVLTQAYVKRLEYYVRKAPYNWFNFYDYWRTN